MCLIECFVINLYRMFINLKFNYLFMSVFDGSLGDDKVNIFLNWRFFYEIYIVRGRNGCMLCYLCFNLMCVFV